VSDPTLMRAFLDAVEPPGSLWRPAPGGDLDKLTDGFGDGLQAVKDFLATLAYIRDPWRTPFLEEIEREFGIMPNVQLTDAQRRGTLALAKYARRRPSTISNLQNALDRAGLGTGGYGLQVYANDPPVDPGPFTNYAFQMYLGGPNGYLGYAVGGVILAYMGVNGGLWVVNGDVFTQAPAYESLGGSESWLGYIPTGYSSTTFMLGQYYRLYYIPNIIQSPADAGSWPLVFFIAAGCTRGMGVNSFIPTWNPTNSWYSICADPSGNIWATEWPGDIYKCPSGSTTFTGVGGTSRNWYSICADPSGNIWAADRGGKIYKCSSGSTTFNVTTSASAPWYSICADPSGNIWAVEAGGDIYKCPSGSTTFTGVGGTSRNWCFICADPSGNIWAVVPNGDIYKCPSGSTTFTGVGGASRYWYGICSDPSGNIWAIVSSGDIYKCPSGSTTFTGVGGTSRNWYSICADPSGNIWATEWPGDIYKCPSGSTTFTGVGGTSRNWYSICADPSGNIWAMVYNGDIYQGKYLQNMILSLTMGSIPSNLRQTLIEIILRWKPIHTWCALMCNYL